MNLKKIITFMAVLFFSFCISQKVFASETAAPTSGIGDDGVTWTVVEEDLTEDMNGADSISEGIVGYNPEPLKPLLKSVYRPSSVWNIASKGKYNFAGTSNGSTLYTNYKFKGKNTYTVYVKNYGKHVLKVKAKRLTKTYATTSISAGKAATFTFSGIQKDTEFYVTFDGSTTNFKGDIK
ncbi:hypothetical protein [Listeria monocytogenes]|uniref:hypothetical protein n=1 Tax=Listeria monocytogenes TaxID=1639 RepID=UPI000D6FAEBE|nr:hypothetical protein [Listeria monocytogenes]EAG9320732.1 hypothetical protein [Listeria monocytogenes]PWR39238.1 hypothetical protein DK324_00240 [Listeria monocytogenes]HCW3273984.1 hypothetical protein [Listeria monocytogenes]